MEMIPRTKVESKFVSWLNDSFFEQGKHNIHLFCLSLKYGRNQIVIRLFWLEYKMNAGFFKAGTC